MLAKEGFNYLTSFSGYNVVSNLYYIININKFTYKL